MPLPEWPDTSAGAAGADGTPIDSGGTGEAISYNLYATVYAPTKTEDAEGGRTVTWLSVAYLPCRIDKVRPPQNVEIAGAVRTVAIHEILFPLTDAVLDGLIAGQKRLYVDSVGAMEIINTDLGLSDATACRAWCVKLGPRDSGDSTGL
jgi:hypothetical protein